MRAVIGKKEEIAKLTCYAEFDLQGEEVDFTPGQYFFVTLKPNDEEHKDELTHHFSIVNSPNQKGVLVLTTRLRLDESLFKRTINDAKVGDEVEIGKIAGEFILPDDTGKPIVLIALGIGITPYRSMLRWAMEENKPYKFTVFYSDDNKESMAFLDELQQMEKDHDNLKLVCIITKDESWQGEKRHVDGELLKDYLDDINKYLYYISGPPKAVTAVAENLKQAQIPDDNIKTDSFSGY
ncbi:FAD-dependent oxidoreductase [Candidatus Saccharibacteria bacterium]|nr:FAD-dependent oxidoreductase [Candidatus Saccharibacteria bacterium]